MRPWRPAADRAELVTPGPPPSAPPPGRPGSAPGRGRFSLLLGVILMAGVLTTVGPGMASVNWGSREGEPEYGAPGTLDFVQYWAAGRLFFEGRNPYDAAAVRSLERDVGLGDETILMRSPPWTLSLILPLLVLPFGVAATVWLLVNLGLISVSLFALRGAFRAREPSLVASVAATVCFYPILETLIWGQFSLVLLASVSLFLLALVRGRSFLAGLLLAPILIKPHLFLIFGAILLWTTLRQRRLPLVYGLGIGFALLLIPVVLINPGAFGQWFESVRSGSTAVGVTPVADWQSTTLAGFARTILHGFTGSAPVWPMWAFPLLGLGVTVTWSKKITGGPDLARLAPPLLAVSYIFAPYGWLYDQAILLPLQLGIVCRAFDTDSYRSTGVRVLAALLGIQAVALLVGLREGSAQHEFFWIPLAMLGVWFWHTRTFDGRNA